MFFSEYYQTNLIFCDIRNGYFRLTILSIYATFFKVSPLVQKQTIVAHYFKNYCNENFK